MVVCDGASHQISTSDRAWRAGGTRTLAFPLPPVTARYTRRPLKISRLRFGPDRDGADLGLVKKQLPDPRPAPTSRIFQSHPQIITMTTPLAAAAETVTKQLPRKFGNKQIFLYERNLLIPPAAAVY